MLGHKIAATRTTNAGLWAWGQGTGGQLGDNSILSKSSPVQVAVARRWASVAAGQSNMVAVSGTQLWVWGLGTTGQMGNGSALSSQVPVQIASDKTWSSVAAGFTHVMAITTAGALWAWGFGTSGQLGQITAAATTSSPVQIASDKTWASAAGGGAHTVAVTTDGALWAWGLNNNGQLAQLTFVTNRSSPVQIASDKTWSAVAAGRYHSAAITTAGALWAWGQNNNGAVGDNTAVSKSSPVQIASDKTWSVVAAGIYYTVAVTTAGTLWAWGNNAGGQLGQITSITNRSSPVQIASDKTWASIAVGATHVAAITTSGQLWAWGLGTTGQLGQITAAVSASSPVQVGHFANWSKVSAGNIFTAAAPG